MVKPRVFLALFIPTALILSLAIGVFIIESPVSADPGSHYYVDATNGSDTYGDGSQTWIDNDPAGWGPEDTGPWKTISHAVDNVPAGVSATDPNVIHVADGTYDNTNNGESFPITFEAENVSLVADFTGALIDQEFLGTGTGIILKIEATGITIDGFTLDNAGFGIVADVGGFSILDNTFSNGTDYDISYGVYVNITESELTDDFSFDSILIDGNEFNIASEGVHLNLDIDLDHAETNLDIDIGDIEVFDNEFNMDTTYGVAICIGVSDVDSGDVTIGDIDVSDGNTFTDGDYGVYFNSYLRNLDDATVTIGELMINDNTFTDQGSYAVYFENYYQSAHNGYGNDNWRGDTTVTIGDIEVNGNDISSAATGCYGIYIQNYGYWEYVEDNVVITAGGIYVEDNDPIDIEGSYAIYVDYYYLEYFRDNAQVTLGDVSIQNNVITAGADSGDYAIYFYYDDVGYDFNGNASFTSGDFYISGNEITECGGDAIYAYFDDFGYSMNNDAVVTLGNLYIEDNEIGTNTEVGGDGIYVEYYSTYDIYDYAQCVIGDVHIEDNSPINANGYGIYLYYDNMGYQLYNNARFTMGNTYIMNNTGIDVTTNDGIYVEYYHTGYYAYSNTVSSIGDIHIEGNEIGSDGNNVGGNGIYLEYEDLAYYPEDYSAFKLGDTFIEDNVIYADDYGMHVYYYDCAYYMYDDSTADFGDLNIEDNDIYAAGSEGIYIYYYDSAYSNENDSVTTFGNINITGNDIEAAGEDGIYLEMSYFGSSLYNNAQVTFGDVNITGGNTIDADDYGVYLYFGDYFGYDLNNYAEFTAGDVNIQNNVITATDYDGIYVQYYDGYYIYDNAKWEVGSLNIEGNDVTSTNSIGIYAYYSYCGAYMYDYSIARIGNTSISDNGIDAGGYGVYLEYYEVGYELYDGAQVLVGDATISGNHAVGDDNAPLTATGEGIYLYYNDCGSSTCDYSQATFGDVAMQNNLIDSDGYGIYLDYYEVGYYMYDSSDMAIGEIDISGNDIDAGSEAIYIEYEYVAYYMKESLFPCEATLNLGDISIRDNTIAGDSDGIYIYYYDYYVGYDMYDDAYAKLPSYIITGNTFNVTGDGIYLYSYENPCDIYDNTTFDFGGMLIDDNTFNGLARNAGDPMDNGIYIYLDDFCYSNYGNTTTIIGDYTVSNNRFYDLDSDAIYIDYNDIGYSLYDDSTLEVGDLVIADNVIDGAANGIWVYYYIYSYDESTATMGNLDITGNNLSNITTDGIYLYYGLYAYSNSTQTIGRALIQDNILDGSSEDGIYVYMSLNPNPDATITLGEPIIDRNIITEWTNGIYLQDVDGATVTNNFIMDNSCGIYLDGSDNIDISNNDILRNPGAVSGVHLDSDCGGNTTINYNNIVANSSGDWGVYNASSNVIDAENNWWGDPSGPDDDDNIINGSGDKISTNVDADPWLTQQSYVTIYEQTATATGSGIASIQTDGGAIVELESIAEGTLPTAGKPDLSFPHGFFSFKVIGLELGQEVTVTLTLPVNVPVGTEYWKYGPTLEDPTDHWYSIPIGDDDGDNIITITLVDGGVGDHDLTENGEIIEPGAPGFVPPAVEKDEEEIVPRPRPQPVPGVEEPTGVARFIVSNLYISPNDVQPNQAVGIWVDIKNVGRDDGVYSATLYVGSEKEGVKNIYLKSGSRNKVYFQTSRPDAGTYSVSVANQVGWFTVREWKVEVAPSSQAGGLGTPGLIAIILGSVGVGIAIFFARRRTA